MTSRPASPCWRPSSTLALAWPRGPRANSPASGSMQGCSGTREGRREPRTAVPTHLGMPIADLLAWGDGPAAYRSLDRKYPTAGVADRAALFVGRHLGVKLNLQGVGCWQDRRSILQGRASMSALRIGRDGSTTHGGGRNAVPARGLQQVQFP